MSFHWFELDVEQVDGLVLGQLVRACFDCRGVSAAAACYLVAVDLDAGGLGVTEVKGHGVAACRGERDGGG